MFNNLNNLFSALNDEGLNDKVSFFFRSSLEQKNSFCLSEFSNYNINRLVEILYGIYTWVTISASGAGGGLNKACKGAENFKSFISNTFSNSSEIRSIEKWEKIFFQQIEDNYGKIYVNNNTDLQHKYNN